MGGNQLAGKMVLDDPNASPEGKQYLSGPNLLTGSPLTDYQRATLSLSDAAKQYLSGPNLLTGSPLTDYQRASAELSDATDPAQISPTGGTPSLARAPRSGGSLLGTAASRSLSRSAFSRKRSAGLSQPMLSGY